MAVRLYGPPGFVAWLTIFVMVVAPVSFAEESRFEVVDKLVSKVSNQLAETEECSSLVAPEGCTISEGCTHIECKLTFAGKSVVITVTINRCEEPETVTAKIEVPEDDISWSETYKTGKAVQVPGFSVSAGALASVGVYLKVDMTPRADHVLVLKVTLLAGAKLDIAEVFLLQRMIVSQALPLSAEHCDFVRWWKARNLAECVVILISFVLFVVVLVTGCCCCGCCCCCRPCRSKRAGVV